MERRIWKGDDQDWHWFWSIGGRPVGTACMDQGGWTFGLGFENVLHEESKVSTLYGHKTPNLIGSMYAGIISRDSVQIAFTYADLNSLNVCAADIRNSYLQAPSYQKDYIICIPEFGINNVRKVSLIHRALYGGKSAGRNFRNHIRFCMRHLKLIWCPSNPGAWMQPAIHGNIT